MQFRPLVKTNLRTGNGIGSDWTVFNTKQHLRFICHSQRICVLKSDNRLKPVGRNKAQAQRTGISRQFQWFGILIPPLAKWDLLTWAIRMHPHQCIFIVCSCVSPCVVVQVVWNEPVNLVFYFYLVSFCVSWDYLFKWLLLRHCWSMSVYAHPYNAFSTFFLLLIIIVLFLPLASLIRDQQQQRSLGCCLSNLTRGKRANPYLAECWWVGRGKKGTTQGSFLSTA